MTRTITFKSILAVSLIGCIISQVATAQDSWVSKANFKGSKRWGAVSFSIGKKGYLGTGNDGTNKKDFWEWDQTTNVWTQVADFGGAARYQAVGFSIGNMGYVGTGAAGLAFPFSPLYRDMWQYNPATNQWKKKKDLTGTVRFGAVGFSIGTKGYIGTGFNDTTYFLGDFWQYDTLTDTWAQKENVPGTARMEAAGFSIAGKGYLGTGGNYMTGTVLLKDFYEYDPATGHWTAKADFGGVGRSTAVGFATTDKGYIGIGGDFSSVAYTDFWEYDPIHNEWAAKADFAGAGRWLSTGFGIGSKGYISTGGNFTPTFNDLWEYVPAKVGVNPMTNNSAICVYPNPSKGIFALKCTGGQFQSFTIYDVKGAKVYESAVYSEITMVDLSDKPAGMYIVHVATPNGTVTEKITLSK